MHYILNKLALSLIRMQILISSLGCLTRHYRLMCVSSKKTMGCKWVFPVKGNALGINTRPD